MHPRRSVPTLSLVVATLLGAGHSPSQTGPTTDPYDVFEARVLARVRAVEVALDCRIALAFRDKDFPLVVEYRADERFHAASTMKTPVLIEVFRQADAGEFSLDDEIIVDPICASFLEDSTFVCDAGEYLTSRLNKSESIRKIAEQMIVVSDNLATNLLLAKSGYRRVNSTMRALGASRGYVLRGVQDTPAYEAGLSNRMTAADLNRLNEAIDRDLAGTPESCAAMREILLAQRHNGMIPAKLPEGVRVAHKTGEVTGVRHDSGIVYAPFGTWYLTVLTDELADGDAGKAAIANLSRFVFDERQRIDAELPDIQHSFEIEFTPSRIALIKEYAKAHYSEYYEATIGSPEMPGLAFAPKVLVVHYTAGATLQGAFNTFAPETLGGRPDLTQAGAVNVGIQFVVDYDGTVYQLQPDNYFGRHVIGLNHCAIGFENIGNGDISEAALAGQPQDDTRLTLAQLQANVALIRFLKHKYPDIQVLVGHSEYRDLEDPTHPGHGLFQENDPDYRTVKSDTGPRFMGAIRAALADLLEPGRRGQVFKR